MTAAAEAAPPRPATAGRRWGGLVLEHAHWMMGAYLLVLLALQVTLQSGGRYDDAEQILYAQGFALAYGYNNPPLLSWIAAAAALPAGAGFVTVRLVLVALLFATALFVRDAALRVTGDRRLAGAAALGLLLLPHYHYHALTFYSHSVLLAAACAMTLAALLRLLDRPDRGSVLWLGAALGAGLLAKYNFALFAAALLLPVLAAHGGGAAAARRPLLAAVGLGVAAALPHYAWLWAHRDAARQMMNQRLGVGQAADGLSGAADGVLSVLAAAADFAGPLLLAALALGGLALWRRGRGGGIPVPHLRLLAVQHGLLFAAPALFAAASGATHYPPYHFFTLVTLPVLVAAAAARGGLGDTVRRWAPALATLAMLACIAAYGRWTVHLAHDCTESGANACTSFLPYRAYAAQLRAAGFSRGTVALMSGGDFFGAVQITPHLPGARLIELDRPRAFVTPALPADRQGDCLVLWKDGPDEAVLRRFADALGLPAGAVAAARPDTGTATGTLRFGGRPAPVLRYARFAGGIGSCR